MANRAELIAKAEAKWKREQLIAQAEAKWQAEQSAKNPSPAQSGLRGALGGLTASFDDEFTGAIGAAGRVAGVKNLGSWKPFDPDSKLEMASEPLSREQIAQAYRENRDSIRQEQHKDAEINPKATLAGNLVGAIASPVGKLAAPRAIGPMTKAGQLANASKTAAMQGAAFSAGASEADLTKGEVGQFAADTALGAATGAVIPPAIEGVKKVGSAAARATGQAASWTGRKFFSSVFGVTEENAKKYLARREAINAAPELAQIKNQVDDAVLQISKEVDSGKSTLEQAKSAVSELKLQIRHQLQDAKLDARESLRKSEEILKEAASKAIAPLKEVKAPTDRAGEVAQMVGALKDKVSTLSGKAFDTLDSANAKVDLGPVYSEIDDAVAKLKGFGTSEADAVAAKLADYRTRLLKTHWAGVSAPEAKKLIQGLDQVTAYNPSAGAFDKAANQSFKGVRRTLDQSLKETVPEYRAAMSEVADQTRLLSKADEAFGRPEIGVSKLGRLNAPRGEYDLDTLKRLEQATGNAGIVSREAEQFAKAQALLKDPSALEKMRRSLPEYDAYRQAMAKLARMKPNWSREQMERALSNSKEARALKLAESNLSRAEARFDPVSALRPDSTESKLKSVMRPASSTIETRKALEQLEKESGKSFLQSLDDRAVLDSFSKPYANGARNTLLWTVLGTAMGGLPGAGIGASYGQLIDRYGPKMGKAILDGAAKLKANPSVQTIRGLNLPPAVKAEMEREFRLIVLARESGGRGSPAGRVAEDEPKTGPDRWARVGVEKLGIQDPALVSRLMQSKDGKQLLIEASGFEPGSRGLERIREQLQKGMGVDNGRKSGTAAKTEVLRREREPARGR